MAKALDGSLYLKILRGGLLSVDKYKKVLNDLNVFPVPDGDTGTNMAMTLRCGFDAVRDSSGSLSEIAGSFASAAVYGARGNSGVIISQFFKGIAESLGGVSEADVASFAAALESGYKRAYSAVAKPAEGTMLTVLKDASVALSCALPIDEIDEAICVYLAAAEKSLENTPELLPILKKAGVVDSGAKGVCCFFDGARRILMGESIEVEEDAPADNVPAVDFSLFDVSTRFEYGYCVEGLIQLNRDPARFKLDLFREALESVGSSVVISLEGDKLKIHVHVKDLSSLMKYCQSIGEFLTVKIDNMTVQNMEKSAKAKELSKKPEKFLYREGDEECAFAVVAVATTERMQRQFSDMGADVVILSDIAPSSGDFIDAFGHTGAKDIIVFPNSSNSILSSVQAGGFYKGARVHVLNSRSSAECYLALAMMDFTASAADALDGAKNAISDVVRVGVYHAVRDVKFGSRSISKNDFFSIREDKIINVGEALESVAIETARITADGGSYSVLTVFYGENIAEEYVEYLVEKINEALPDVEVSALSTDESAYSLMLAFE